MANNPVVQRDEAAFQAAMEELPILFARARIAHQSKTRMAIEVMREVASITRRIDMIAWQYLPGCENVVHELCSDVLDHWGSRYAVAIIGTIESIMETESFNQVGA